MYQFRKALVVGKFAPFHLGHKYLIETALRESRKVAIISYSNPNPIQFGQDYAEKWIRHAFTREQDRLQFIKVPEGVIPPHNDAEDIDHREFCFNLLTSDNTTVDAVFTSEWYGRGFAEYLTNRFQALLGKEHQPVVEHVMVDQLRVNFPTSGTMIRNTGIMDNRFVPSYVQADFVTRIAVLGGESTGKSTFVDALYAAIGKDQEARVGTVHEYGRTLYEQTGGRLIYDDMLYIGQTQAMLEDEAAHAVVQYSGTKQPIVICDTTPLTTLFYSYSWYNGFVDEELIKLAFDRPYSLYVLCAPDIPFDQDGTRIGEEFRMEAHMWYQEILTEREIPYIVVEGTTEGRVAKVMKELSL